MKSSCKLSLLVSIIAVTLVLAPLSTLTIQKAYAGGKAPATVSTGAKPVVTDATGTSHGADNSAEEIIFETPGDLPKLLTADIKKAKEFFAKGSRQFENGEFDGASKYFTLSYQNSGNPLLLFNIAKSLQEASDLPAAKRFYNYFLDALPKAENREEVEREIAKIDKALAETYGNVEVVTRDKKVYRLSINNSEGSLCYTPCRIPLKFGDYTLFVKEPTGSVRPYNLKIKKGATERLDVHVDPKDPAGEIRLETEDSVKVSDFYVGDIHAGEGEKTLRDVPVGEHEVTVVSPTLIWKGRAIVKRDRTTSIALALAQMESVNRVRNSWKDIVAYTSIGLGSASLVSGGVLGYFTLRAKRALAREKTGSYNLRTEFTELGKSEKVAANVLYGVGATFLATGIGMLVWSLMKVPEVRSDIVFLPNK